jgi:pimeloyl-ACP methyl ester carboxylesterase
MPATPADPMRHDETVLTVAGSPVRAYRAGAGPALVLLHGDGLDDAQLSWAPLWPALAGHARLLAPDLPGYGASALGDTAPTLEGYRAWLLAFLDAAGLQTAVLAGLSLGGGIALRTALDAPARVAGLVLLAPYGISPRLPGGTIGYLAGQIRALLTRPGAGAAWQAFRHHEARWAGPRKHLTGELGAIGCPVLLLSGDHDRLVLPADVRAAATRIPHARFTPVAGAGHRLPRDAPGQVAGQLIAFLATAPAAPAARPDGL